MTKLKTPKEILEWIIDYNFYEEDRITPAIKLLDKYYASKICYPNSSCELCWTSSWAPCPKDFPDARKVKGKDAYVVCQQCQAVNSLIETKEALKRAHKVFGTESDKLAKLIKQKEEII